MDQFFCLNSESARSLEIVYDAGSEDHPIKYDDDDDDDMEEGKDDEDNEADSPIEALKKARERNRQLAERIRQLETENDALNERSRVSMIPFPLSIFGYGES